MDKSKIYSYSSIDGRVSEADKYFRVSTSEV
jgi:hypothetical protein